MGTHEALMGGLEDVERMLDEILEFNVIKTKMKKPGESIFFLPGKIAKGGKTLNFDRMGKVLYYGWSVFCGDKRDQLDSEMYLRQFLDDEKQSGHMSKGAGTEQCCADPHYNFHNYSMGLAWKISKLVGHDSVFQRITNWFQEHYALYSLFASPNRNRCNIAIPGTRFEREDNKIHTSWDVVEVAYREFFGLRHIGNSAEVDHPIWTKFRDYACARIIRKYGIGKYFEKYPFTEISLPKLKLELICQKYSDGVVGILRKPNNGIHRSDLIVDYTVFPYYFTLI